MSPRERLRRALLAWEPGPQDGPPEGEWAGQVTAIVTTFERACCVARFLRSLRRRYPTLAVLVSDASRESLFEDGTRLHRGITWRVLPGERGHSVGAGRNFLVEQVETEYFFLADDDHEVSSGTDLQRMHAFLERTGYDLVAGCQGREDYGNAVFEQTGDGLVLQHFYRFHREVEPGVVACDRVSNTFLARTRSVAAVGWEERVLAAEHAEFFWRASRAGLKIAQMGGVWVDHDRRCEDATGIGRLLGWLLPHRDLGYLRRMVGGGGILARPGRAARELERRYCHEKNQIRGIRSRARRADLVRLHKVLGASC